MWPIIVIIAQLTAAQLDAAKASYHQMAATDVEAHKAADKPPKNAHKVDVSPRMKSASFGHKTWLVITADGAQFWVEYGKSTNAPAALYGPFAVTAPAK
jgi:soluble cytochrome b562